MYNLEEKIIRFVFMAFDGKRRKKEDIDMAYHSIMVGSMLKSAGCPENIVNIGYLHDVVEDTSYGYEDILKKFGKKLADGVLALSEDKSIIDYRARKKDFLDRLQLLDNDLLMVELADKLHNLLSDYEKFEVDGVDVLITEADDYESMKWFYLSLKQLFNDRLKSCKLLDRYNEITKLYFE